MTPHTIPARPGVRLVIRLQSGGLVDSDNLLLRIVDQPRWLLRTRGELADDLEGVEFDSISVARRDAIVAARQIMADRILRGEPADHSQFEFADETGAIVPVVPFEEAIRP